ncbi:WhiB family transcriptional regulator [Streptomyces sp. NPDC102405]|uniref:WhiB family transcriptional regulator n=1 Tax=Streptomyces sp. NPDC102405 TaxID=3366170 RepID=UPI0037F97957
MSAGRYEWMDQASCAQADPDTWADTAPGTGSRLPKRICGECPVQPECAAHEMQLREQKWEPLAGIWGGTSQRQRLKQQAA